MTERGAVDALFASLARLRGGKRVFHPVGDAYEGVLRVDGDPDLDGAPLLARRAEHPVIVRLSRGGGLPDWFPDVLGVAVKLPDAHGPGRDQDFLLATSGTVPPLYHLLLPATSSSPPPSPPSSPTGWGSACASSAPYPVPGRR